MDKEGILSFWATVVWSYQTLLEVLSTTWFWVLFGIGVILLLCVEKKSSPSWFWIYSYISIVLLRKFREQEMIGCEKKRLSLSLVIWYLWVAIWNCERGFVTAWFWFCSLVICSLLVCCNFWIWFVALSLVCAQLVFGICIWYLWTFSSLFCIWEREVFGYLGFGFVRVPLHQFVLS